MKKIVIFMLSVLLFVFFSVIIVNRQKEQILAKRINTNIKQIGEFDTLIIACQNQRIYAIKLFEKKYKSQFNIKTETSIENLKALYSGKNSYAFVIDKNQIEQMRKNFPRMSFIEMEENSFLQKNKVFFISKNKCNCEK